jgi:hypothetical protein
MLDTLQTYSRHPETQLDLSSPAMALDWAQTP